MSGFYSGAFDEDALSKWAAALRAELRAPKVSLGLVFVSPSLLPDAAQILQALRIHAAIPLLAGCSSTSLIAGGEEKEDFEGLALGLYYLPGAELKSFRFTQTQVEESADRGTDYWPSQTGVISSQTNGWLVFADPFTLDCDTWLRGWDAAYSPAPTLGGLASGSVSERSTNVFLNGDVLAEGGVAISIGGDVALQSVISQGCTPIGETWTITQADRNFIYRIGNRPAYEVLVETYNKLPPNEQQKCNGNMFVGLVINEYLEDFHRGDFLIRNLMGADPKSGILAVGALPRAGQTMQFQRRDAEAATEDMESLLTLAKEKIGSTQAYGGWLGCCNGRGERLFGKPSHDASMIQQRLGPIGLSGFFCNGEIGPVGQHSFLHGYTASLCLFVKKQPA